MFQLSEGLESWKNQLAGSKAYSKSDLDELESHILDEIENLTQYPLTDEEAFMIATNRLGSVKDLNEEFKKVNIGFFGLRRFFEMLTGYILLSFIRVITVLIAQTILTGILLNVQLQDWQLHGLNLLLNGIFGLLILYLLFFSKVHILHGIQRIILGLMNRNIPLFILTIAVVVCTLIVAPLIANTITCRLIMMNQAKGPGSIMLSNSVIDLLWFTVYIIFYMVFLFKQGRR